MRVGVANQRTVLRTLELPPVTDQKELAAAVTFQAQDQVPMPLNNAVLDFHPLGIIDTPAGPRQRVVLVAAQRDMVERLLTAVRRAGLTPEGVDLSAFALIRSLYRHDPEQAGRVLYLNVDGLTNLAIAEGKICRFTRVVGSGLEGMAVELAERRGIALMEARELLAGVDLSAPAPAPERARPGRREPRAEAPRPVAADGPDEGVELPAGRGGGRPRGRAGIRSRARALSHEPERGTRRHSSRGRRCRRAGPCSRTASARSPERSATLWTSTARRTAAARSPTSSSAAPPQDINGFADALQLALGVEVRNQSVGLVDERVGQNVSKHRLAVATGLASTEAPQ